MFVPLLAAMVGCGKSHVAELPDSAPRFRDGGFGPGDFDPQICSEPPSRGQTGGACLSTSGSGSGICQGGLECIPESAELLGGPSDPIVGLPPGAPGSIDTAAFPGNYCAVVLPRAGDCEPRDRAACAERCGVCTTGVIPGAMVCLAQCTPNAIDNDICRDGYQCHVLRGACQTGCSSNEECRVAREDTNEDGVIEPYDPATGSGDRLVYRADSQAFCNPETARCEHPGTPGVFAGAPCVADEQCEANGRCFDEVEFGFPGGYCTKLRCDFEGNDCAGESSVCHARGIGYPVCLEGCRLGTDVVPGDRNTYVGNTQGCRDGYACYWDGRSGDGPLNGGCLPGVFNAIATPSVGDACTDDVDCHSPLGLGACLEGSLHPEGYCTVFDCAAPGVPDDLCGDGGTCVSFPTGAQLCMATCTTAEDCRPGYACGDTDGDVSTVGKVCFGDCLDASECRNGEACDSGRCTPG